MVNKIFKTRNSDKQQQKGTQNLKTAILSIIFAIAIWLMAVYIANPSIKITVKDVDVRFSGEMNLKEQGYVITGKNKLPSMSVSVRGRRSDLIEYMDDVYITIDVSKANELGEHSFSATAELPTTQLTLEKFSNTEVTLNVEKLEKKSIQILYKQTGSNKDYIVHSQIDDDYIEISGAKSEVDKVAYGIATVDISSVKSNFESDYGYSMYDKNNAVISTSETLEAKSAAVHIRNTLYERVTLQVIPELSPELSDEYIIDSSKTVISPSTVEVGISDKFTEVGVAANIDKLTDNETEFYLKDAEGLYIPDSSRAVKIQPIAEKKYTKVMKLQVNALNIPEGKTADFVQEINVNINCAENVNAEDIKAEIDLSGLTNGSYNLPLHITSVKPAALAETVNIDVTIK